jgi:hypothetical protein
MAIAITKLLILAIVAWLCLALLVSSTPLSSSDDGDDGRFKFLNIKNLIKLYIGIKNLNKTKINDKIK